MGTIPSPSTAVEGPILDTGCVLRARPGSDNLFSLARQSDCLPRGLSKLDPPGNIGYPYSTSCTEQVVHRIQHELEMGQCLRLTILANLVMEAGSRGAEC